MTASPGPPSDSPVAVRLVKDIATLKALSDGTRLAILRALMAGAHGEPRVMSVKEIAEEVGQPQTNLYRHIKQLEAQELIAIARTRLVSGIVEHRYRANQLTFHWDRDLLGDRTVAGDTPAMVQASFDQFRDEYVAGIRSERVRFGKELPAEQSYLNPIVAMADRRVPASRAAELRARLAILIDEFMESDNDEDGVPIRLFAAFFSPSPPGPSGHPGPAPAAPDEASQANSGGRPW